MDKATSITNPSPALAGGGIGQGQVGGNGATLGSGNSRYFVQSAAFRVSDILAALGTANLADLANYTFTYAGVTEASTVDVPDSSIYHAAYAGQWEDTGASYTDLPLKSTVTDANAQNMGATPSATNSQRTLFCNAGDAVSGFGGAAPVQTVNLIVPDLASTAQTLNATGFDLSGLATSLAGDTDLTNNYVFFCFYLNPKVVVGTAIFQNFSSVALVPVEKTLRTVESGTLEVAGPNNTDVWGYGAGLTQTGGTLRFEYDWTGPDKALVTGDYTQTGGDIALNLTTRPPVGTPIPLIAYSGAMTGTPSITLEPGTRYTVASTSMGDGSDDAVAVTIAGAHKSLFWTGAAGEGGSAWDLNTSTHWVWDDSGTEVPDKFFTADDVTFDDGTGTAPVQTFAPVIDTTLYPYAVKFDNTTNDYTLSGNGGIGGGATFTHIGGGKVTILTTNTHAGANSVSNPSGKLQLGDGATTGTLGTGALSLAGELILKNPGIFVFANTTTGSGSSAKITQDAAAVAITGSLAGALNYNMAASQSLNIGNGGTTGGLDAATVVLNVPATATATFHRTNTGDVIVAGKLAGAGDVIFKGSGTLNQSAYALSGNTATDFTGTFTIDAARLAVDNANDLSAAASTAVLPNGQIFISAGSISKAITIQGDGWLESAGRLGALRFGSVTYSGDITLAGDSRIGVIGSSATVSGSIGETGSRALELYNNSATASTLFLSGPATGYSGGTTIRGLTCYANSASALGGGPVVVEAHPTTAPTTSSNSNLTFSSTSTPVTVTNAVTVKPNAAMLGSGGTSGAVVIDGGLLSPGPNTGTTIGTLATGALEIKAGSTLRIDFNSPLATQKFDRINAGGDVTIDPSAILAVADKVTSKATFANGAKFVILDYTGHTLTGSFSGKPQGSQIVDGPNTLTLNYNDTSDGAGNTGNYVTLSIGTAYDLWTASKGLDGTPGKEKGFYDDPEKDGTANGLEWILGGNPLAPETTPPVTTTRKPNGDLELKFNRLEASIPLSTLSVEYSATLAAGSWTSTAIGAAGAGIVAIDTDATPDAVTVTIPASAAVGGRIFARLKATMP
ncbi:MAG: hypothetical protein J0M04_17950 [Verrucomicrobia bacterium]|nr:hypothetical protein [Verrucomicrobiota bacterium]